MTFKDLYQCCLNFITETNMTVLEEGKEPVRAKLGDIYNELLEKKVSWFSVEQNGYTVIIKLCREE